ncbi:hypothetical protein [Gordonia sp. CPCC 205333]|uniref:hypothetical protein n=1 Tax=Gordonia sp. CPCC 205333 TaxID=3140790 RepID=UPI003AF39C50
MTYPGGTYQPSGPHSSGQPPEPPRSPWRSPIVLMAVAAGVLLVVAGVLGALILIPESESSPAATSSTTTVSRPDGSIVTSIVPRTPPTLPTTPTTHSNPTVAGTDWQGFTDGPRCNSSKDPAVAIGLTDRSRVVICQVGGSAGLYYKGTADGKSVEIDFPVRSGSTFTATNDGYSYVIGPDSLIIARGGTVLNSEPMIAYWSD